MATDSPLSARKLTANRKNAQRSTGPRTATGKAASARNATTLGLFTKRDYVRPNERAEYLALGARYAAELRPEGALEESLLAAIVSAIWRMRRCSLVEYDLAIDSRKDPMQYAWNRETQNSVDRARSQSSLLLRRHLLELRRAQTDRFLNQKLLAHEPGLPALATPKLIVSVINQHNRGDSYNLNKAKAQAAADQPKSVALICETESQTPRNGRCPCGSGEKFKRCCGKLAPPVLGPAPSVRPYPSNGESEPQNPGKAA